MKPVDTQKVRSLLRDGARRLHDTSESARLDAELLLAHQLGWNRIQLVTEADSQVSSRDVREYQELLERRALYEPVAYIVGWCEFWESRFIVTPEVLIPRPETEHLVEFALARLMPLSRASILDLGTGSGCLIISLLEELKRSGKDVAGVAVDLSAAALEVASKNARANGVEHEIKFVLSNWCENLPAQKFDCVVANPPYVALGDPEVSPDVHFEPDLALYAESDGLANIEEIIRTAPEYLKTGASLLIETGYQQRPALEDFLQREAIVKDCYRDYIFHRDMAGLQRVVELVRS